MRRLRFFSRLRAVFFSLGLATSFSSDDLGDNSSTTTTISPTSKFKPRKYILKAEHGFPALPVKDDTGRLNVSRSFTTQKQTPLFNLSYTDDDGDNRHLIFPFYASYLGGIYDSYILCLEGSLSIECTPLYSAEKNSLILIKEEHKKGISHFYISTDKENFYGNDSPIQNKFVLVFKNVPDTRFALAGEELIYGILSTPKYVAEVAPTFKAIFGAWNQHGIVIFGKEGKSDRPASFSCYCATPQSRTFYLYAKREKSKPYKHHHIFSALIERTEEGIAFFPQANTINIGCLRYLKKETKEDAHHLLDYSIVKISNVSRYKHKNIKNRSKATKEFLEYLSWVLDSQKSFGIKFNGLPASLLDEVQIDTFLERSIPLVPSRKKQDEFLLSVLSLQGKKLRRWPGDVIFKN